MADERELPPGASGVFKLIADGARKLKRAISEPSSSHEFGQTIAQAFVSGGRFAEIHAMTTPLFQERNPRDSFCARWREAALERGPFTGFQVSDAGQIDLGYIPGLEEVPQTQFVAFLQITFSTPTVPIDDDKAFAIGVVLLQDGTAVKIGALHAR